MMPLWLVAVWALSTCIVKRFGPFWNWLVEA
jgi:hypothetical protein